MRARGARAREREREMTGNSTPFTCVCVCVCIIGIYIYIDTYVYKYTHTYIHNFRVSGQALEGHARWTEIADERSKALGKSQGKHSQKALNVVTLIYIHKVNVLERKSGLS